MIVRLHIEEETGAETTKWSKMCPEVNHYTLQISPEHFKTDWFRPQHVRTHAHLTSSCGWLHHSHQVQHATFFFSDWIEFGKLIRVPYFHRIDVTWREAVNCCFLERTFFTWQDMSNETNTHIICLFRFDQKDKVGKCIPPTLPKAKANFQQTQFSWSDVHKLDKLGIFQSILHNIN